MILLIYQLIALSEHLINPKIIIIFLLVKNYKNKIKAKYQNKNSMKGNASDFIFDILTLICVFFSVFK